MEGGEKNIEEVDIEAPVIEVEKETSINEEPIMITSDESIIPAESEDGEDKPKKRGRPKKS
jgi:hypothetical protein